MKMEAEWQKYGVLTMVSESTVLNDQQLDTSKVDGRVATLSAFTASNWNNFSHSID